MKNIFLAVVFLLGCTATAQKIEPTVKELEDGKVKVTFYHENGKIAQEGTMMNGKRDGEWKSYDEKGVKTAQAEYTQDLKTGKWFIWTADELIEIDYSKNQIASVNRWINKEAIADNKP
jgi:antitoxin component YwqK of YwqJK toxin-antitoxin module